MHQSVRPRPKRRFDREEPMDSIDYLPVDLKEANRVSASRRRNGGYQARWRWDRQRADSLLRLDPDNDLDPGYNNFPEVESVSGPAGNPDNGHDDSSDQF
jgi:hypothetical protein